MESAPTRMGKLTSNIERSTSNYEWETKRQMNIQHSTSNGGHYRE